MCNSQIRTEAQLHSVKLWEIAEKLGINDGNFSRKLRRELPQPEKDRILSIIYEIASEKAG